MDDTRFEQAVDAVVQGDLEALRLLLRADASLVEQRSARSHHATLLHYVAANGVENFRQRTPSNIVRIAECLLDAGADVKATCDVYGGGADTLGLVVTSAHPRAIGVQLPLADLLLARGAILRPRLVRDSLANGCPEAATHIGAICLQRGMPLGLQELAGMGETRRVADLLVQESSSDSERGEAMTMAAWYNRAPALMALLDAGVAVDTPNSDGATALHVAAYAGHFDLVHMLCARSADVHRRDARYDSTPRTWAQHAWQVDGKGPEAMYRAIIDHLQQAESLTRP
ncbi:MAG: hypothetical protein C0516_15840 [Gemmatimonas sp.]|uniref:ankyrin repeat domain-containing protein n=1 Tax=Gemmatimonas sp. UBA7669 TaxID=1946568 RepID=UPI0025BF9D6A|nr:ankyrin repeat domain-containing protein [Gemmatimonas sp. UBA7669]MBA3920036.1 hypothetical protein [Gemmatimonas sp.]